MKEYVAQRVLAMIPVLLIVAVFTFSLIQVVPGDPAIILAGDQASPADIARVQKRLGLDKPVHEQFWVWMSNALQGDLGVSPGSKFPVLKQIRLRLEPTVSIGVAALMISVLVAIPLGVLAAWKVNTWIDRSSM
ncbi:MAG: ABC transporter permease, partial [Chloroflexota bacterium]|nr:ABC transporter permease [Chloroflexota bacterium]